MALISWRPSFGGSGAPPCLDQLQPEPEGGRRRHVSTTKGYRASAWEAPEQACACAGSQAHNAEEHRQWAPVLGGPNGLLLVRLGFMTEVLGFKVKT